MGLTKQYLRYLPHSQYGVIGSGRCNVVFLNLRSTSCRYVAAGACEHVNVWDMRTMEKVSKTSKTLASGSGNRFIESFFYL